MHTGVFSDLDFGRVGKIQSSIRIPHSVDRSPYYQVTTPVCRVKNGEGPSILLMGGNHGDEYEGPIALTKLCKTIEAGDVQGEITLIPAVNASAIENNRRCSALDGRNLNRCFLEKEPHDPTEKLAQFIAQELIPRHDVLFDFHSGGTSMDHMPCALTEVLPNEDPGGETLDLLRAMGLPYAFLSDTGTDTPTSLGAARRAGKIGISGEFGGCASATPRSIGNTVRAIDNILMFMGITGKRLLSAPDPTNPETQFLSFGDQNLFLYADKSGWYEPLADIGEFVTKGQPAMRVYDLLSPGEEPRELSFKSGGLVIARRLHSHIRIGDCALTLGRPI